LSEDFLRSRVRKYIEGRESVVYVSLGDGPGIFERAGGFEHGPQEASGVAFWVSECVSDLLSFFGGQ
jgi:hypothetical protein